MTTTIATVKEFLASEVRMLSMMQSPPHIGGYRSMGDFVLQNGVAFEPAPCPKDVRPGELKQCFKNAADLVIHNPSRFIYCEGYAAGVIPVHHAWVFDVCGSFGALVDNTWLRNMAGTDYFGIAINYEYLSDTLLSTERYCSLIDRWSDGWPILTDDPKLWRHPIMDSMGNKSPSIRA